MLCPIVHRTNLGGMDILAQVLDRVRLGGTLLFHFELGHPWNLALPARPYALFHYLSRGSATLALEDGQELQMTEGDFVVITRGEPHVFYSDRRAKPLQIVDLDRSSPRFGVVRHGGRAKPLSTMICGNFTVSRPMFGSVLELLPPVLLLKPNADGGWREAILRRMVSESALERPGQRVALSRLTEVLFVEVLRNWIASLSPGQGGWLGAISDPAYRTGAQVDPRKPGAALDPERPRPARRARPLGIFGALHQARRPVHASLCDRTPDGGSGVPARNQRRAHRTDCEPGRLRDGGGVFKTVSSTSWPVARPLPDRSTP